jgi:hypothetical protein
VGKNEKRMQLKDLVGLLSTGLRNKRVKGEKQKNIDLNLIKLL